MIIFQNNERYFEHRYHIKADLQSDVSANSKALFGQKTIYVDKQHHFDPSIAVNFPPDALLFDLSGEENPRLHLVDIELSSTDFPNGTLSHVAKFRDFLKSKRGRGQITDRIGAFIDSSARLRNEFKNQLGFKVSERFLTDFIVKGDILLITDGGKDQLLATRKLDRDVWGKTVRVHILKKFSNGKESIYSLNPDFNHKERGVSGSSPTEPDEQSTSHLRGAGDKLTTGPWVNLTKISGNSNGLAGSWTGQEVAPPMENERYGIHLEDGNVLRTSPVRLITETKDCHCIMTKNSLYEYRVLKATSPGETLRAFD